MLSDRRRAGHSVSYCALVAVAPTFVERVRSRDKWFGTRCADPTAERRGSQHKEGAASQSILHPLGSALMLG